jgi:hypothetical protein
MNINCGANTPFLISTKVGILGKIGIYIKSRRQIEDEIQADT